MTTPHQALRDALADCTFYPSGLTSYSPKDWITAAGPYQVRVLLCDRDQLAAEVEALKGERVPTIEDINRQEWAGMDGAIAFHLIDRHAEGWAHAARLMHAWRDANPAAIDAARKAEA